MSGEAERPEWVRKEEKRLREAPVRKSPKSPPPEPETIPPYPEGEEEPDWLKRLREESKAKKPPQRKLWPFRK